MKLNELFDQTYPYVWSTKEPLQWIAQFKTSNGRFVDIDIRNMYENEWSVIFKVDDYAGESGDGDQFKIFSTVLRALAEFNTEVHPDQIQFTAGVNKDDNSRARLYRAFIRRFGADFDITEYDRSKPGDAKVKFVLTRKHLY